MKTFQELKKNCGKDMHGFTETRLAVIADCATQMLATALRGYAYETNLCLNVFDGGYNQIQLYSMNPQSDLYAFKPKYVLVQMSSEKLYQKFFASPFEERTAFAENTLVVIKKYWEDILNYGDCCILQFNFPETDDAVWGSLGCKTPEAFIYQQRRLNYLLMEAGREYKNVYLIDLCTLQNRLGREQIFDEKMYYTAKMPFGMSSLPHVAKLVIDMVNTLQGKLKKCVIVDLDNTLWGGVVGDDGLNGIQIGELGAGPVFSEIQMWLKELKNRGIILAVCSKNDEKNAKEPFEKHPDMILRLDDFSMFVANWDDKASNIRVIQQTLNIGMDSIVFLDDNPFERNIVRGLIADITVPELPEDPAQYLTYLRSLALFGASSYNEEDRNRTTQYRSEMERKRMQVQYNSIDDYLIGLEMKAEAKPFIPFYFPRISQLTQRSNQFNLRTIRYTEQEIENITKDDSNITLLFTLMDRYGDYGLVSVVILEKRESELFVNTWLMSCRVLKRGMEEFIINKIIEIARKAGYSTVIGEYIQTPKNAMVAEIYQRMGFLPLGNGRFSVDTEIYIPQKTYIEEDVL